MELAAGYLEVSWKTEENPSPKFFCWIPNTNNILRGNKKQNWKRRYFVLQEAVSTMPGHSASLVYYKDEKCRQVKGTIDLEHCEEVLSTLDSPNYQYLFALRTVHKKKNEARTYYLAADTAGEMEKWVDSLCVVLGLKETQDEEPAAPAPETRLPQSPKIEIPPPIQAIPTSRPPVQARPVEDYIPLDNCTSGPNEGDDEVLSSIPEGYAPRPHSTELVEYDRPSSRLKQVDRNDNVYKTPPSRTSVNPVSHQKPSVSKLTPQAAHESVYKSPPKRDQPDYINDQMDDEIYNVPPSQHKSLYDSPPNALRREPSERDSNSSNGSKHSHLCTDDSGLGSSMDNLAKGIREVKTSHVSQEIYDYPPSSKQVPVTGGEAKKLLESVPPPARLDPKPAETNRAQYVNLNEPKAPEVQYDFPPPSSGRKRTDVEMLGLRPPVPPMPCSNVVTAHQYVNAGAGVVQVTSHMRTPLSPTPAVQSTVRSPAQSSYIPMNQAAGQDSYLPMQQSSSPPDSYLPMQAEPGSPQDSYLPMNRTDSSYLPMTTPRRHGSRGSDSQGPDDYLPMEKDRASTDSTYQVLPPGVHPVSPNNDYDNRLSECSGQGMPIGRSKLQSQVIERDSIYAVHPSNRPVEPRNRGLDAYVPTSAGHASPAARRTRQMDMYPSTPSMVRGDSEIYDTAPSNRPVPPMPGKLASQSPVLNRPSFNKERSRSFKRNLDIPVLPVSKNASQASDSSSDEDSDNDDPSSSSSHDRSVDSISKPAQPRSLTQAEYLKRSLNSTPPPPKKPGEIEYLDLGLDNPSDKERSPVFSRSPATAGNVTPTEYHDIDFVKTQALIETKKDLESKRKSSSSKSVDD